MQVPILRIVTRTSVGLVVGSDFVLAIEMDDVLPFIHHPDFGFPTDIRQELLECLPILEDGDKHPPKLAFAAFRHVQKFEVSNCGDRVRRMGTLEDEKQVPPIIHRHDVRGLSIAKLAPIEFRQQIGGRVFVNIVLQENQRVVLLVAGPSRGVVPDSNGSTTAMGEPWPVKNLTRRDWSAGSITL